MNRIHLLTTAALLFGVAGTAFAQNGAVSGRVTFAGTPPAQKPFTVPAAFTGCGKEVSLDRLILGKDKGVANSVVYIVGLKHKAAAAPATFVADQTGCRYAPHVLVVGDGDAFTALNSDSTFHNVHGYLDATHATVFNVAEPDKGMKMVERVKRPGMYQLRCDVHPWMNGYVFVSGNGYAVLTDADGHFTLPDVPPGTYKLAMWHEGWKMKVVGGRPEFSDAVVQTQEITVTAGQTTPASFALK